VPGAAAGRQEADRRPAAGPDPAPDFRLPRHRRRLFSWAKVTGNVVLGSQKQADGKTAYLIQRAGGANATPIAHVTLDMRGVSCPGPIVQAKKLLDGMKAGEVLQLVSDCPGSADDITSWAKAGAADLLFSHESDAASMSFTCLKACFKII
jgi:TusA-related sulfurtransferase